MTVTIKKRLARSNIAMFLIPVLVAAAVLGIAIGEACVRYGTQAINWAEKTWKGKTAC